LTSARPATPLADFHALHQTARSDPYIISITVRYRHLANVTETQKLSSVDKPAKIGAMATILGGIEKLILD